MRSDWASLPDAVTARIAARVGGIIDVCPAPSGDHAEIASTVTGSAGKVFVKAASGEFGVRSLRYELSATEAIDCAPAVLWHVEDGGWLAVGVEHLDGPHPDLSPGSADLGVLAVALKGLQTAPAPGGTWFTPEARLGFSQPAMAGRSLIHTDLSPANLIKTAGGLRIVDWAWATRAAPWVELTLLVQWLIGAGHTPDQAEEWLSQFPAWVSLDGAVLDEFASKNAAKWSAKSRRTAAGWVHDLAAWTGEWAAHRRNGL
ncbi:aminoglycoside phosphotransferase [Micromonospora sp. NPDC002389]|uniref:phosphotransferase family protein n=1 Tax=Micromonospora sp. NPDC002389 TaxID=3154272 RepID=UPI003318E26E